jgi:hypothetical protein
MRGRDGILPLISQVLAGSTMIRDEAGRRLLLSLVADRVGVNLRPEFDLDQIVTCCAKHPTGLADLVETLADMEGESNTVHRARQLQDEWDAHDLYPEPDLRALHGYLAALAVDNLTRLYQAATDFRAQSLPSHCDGVWSAFVHLAGFNAASDGLPPSMVFLERLADQAGGAPAARLRLWNDRIAADLHVTHQLGAARRAISVPGSRPAKVYLVVQLQPDGLDRGHYLLSHWRQQDPGEWPPRRGESYVVTREEIPRRVGELVGQVEQSLPRSPETGLALEFVLPFELLNIPVEQWTADPASSQQIPEPLVLRYPVVVRSLERMRHRNWHRKWHERWRLLVNTSEPEVLWSERSARSIPDLGAELARDDRIVAVVLSEPPAPDRPKGHREALAALSSGIPVIIWHRKDCSSDAFESAVSHLIRGPLAELPARVQALRRLELAGGDERPETVCRHLTVLWDDPERQPGAWEEEPTAPFAGGHS